MKALNLVAVENEINNDFNFSFLAHKAGKKSFFRFRIKESIETIIALTQKGGKGFYFSDDLSESNRLVIISTYDGWWKAYVDVIDEDHINITCANKKYHYFLSRNEDGGCNVEFDGSIAALLQQTTMPKMTYIPDTLEGTYENFGFYLPISIYCQIRFIRNGDETYGGDEINKMFNNEIPCFRKYNYVEQIEECAA